MTGTAPTSDASIALKDIGGDPGAVPAMVATSPVAGWLERAPIRKTQIMVVALILTALLFDGLHVQLLSFVAPIIIEQWGLSRATLGPAMAAALIGMTVGASFGGWLGDRIGAKRTLIWSVIFFGSATIVTSFSWNLASLIIFRLISGIGLGAAGPAGIALAVDWLPARAKSKAVALLSISAPLGGAVGAVIIGAILPLWGWQGSFMASGIATLLIAALIFLLMPEAWTYLARTGRSDDARRALHRILGQNFDSHAIAPPTHDAAASGRARVPEGCGRLLAGTMISYFSLQILSFAFIAWTTVFLTGKQFSLPQALGASFGVNALAVVGALAAPFILDRVGSRVILRVTGIAMPICLVAVGIVLANIVGVPGSMDAMTVQLLLALIGGMIGIAITTLWVVMAQGYPARYRSTGLGLGMMAGRAGSVAILFAGGALISIDPAMLSAFFATLLIATGGAYAGGLIIDRHLPGRALTAP